MMQRRKSFTLGQNRNNNGEGTRKSSLASGSPEESGNARQKEATSPPAPAATTPGLSTIRLGTLRPEIAHTCTPTPTARRQLILDLLVPKEVGEGAGENNGVAASPALRNIISNKSSSGKSFDKEIGKGDAFSSYTPEEKVNIRFFHLMSVFSVGVEVFGRQS